MCATTSFLVFPPTKLTFIASILSLCFIVAALIMVVLVVDGVVVIVDVADAMLLLIRVFHNCIFSKKK